MIRKVERMGNIKGVEKMENVRVVKEAIGEIR